MLPYRQLLMEEDVFGPDVNQLDPLRFFENKRLARSPYFTPFGSGRNMCPGRFLARKEVLVFTTLVLTRFEIEIDPAAAAAAADKNASSSVAAASFPRMNMAKPILGPLEPISGDDLILKIRPPSPSSSSSSIEKSPAVLPT